MTLKAPGGARCADRCGRRLQCPHVYTPGNNPWLRARSRASARVSTVHTMPANCRWATRAKMLVVLLASAGALDGAVKRRQGPVAVRRKRDSDGPDRAGALVEAPADSPRRLSAPPYVEHVCGRELARFTHQISDRALLDVENVENVESTAVSGGQCRGSRSCVCSARRSRTSPSTRQPKTCS
jgi:hypothetical protein